MKKIKQKLLLFWYRCKFHWVFITNPKRIIRVSEFKDKILNIRALAQSDFKKLERQVRGFTKADRLYSEKVTKTTVNKNKTKTTVQYLLRERAILKILVRESIDEIQKLRFGLNQVIEIIDHMEKDGAFDKYHKLFLEMETLYGNIFNFYQGLVYCSETFNKNAILLAHVASDNYEKEGIMVDEALREVTEDKPFFQFTETDGTFKIKLDV